MILGIDIEDIFQLFVRCQSSKMRCNAMQCDCARGSMTKLAGDRIKCGFRLLHVVIILSHATPRAIISMCEAG